MTKESDDDDQIWDSAALDDMECSECGAMQTKCVPFQLNADDTFVMICKPCWDEHEYDIYIRPMPLDD